MARAYTVTDDDLIRRHFGTIPHRALCEMLRRTPDSLIRHAKIQLGLTCPSRGAMRKMSRGDDWFSSEEDAILLEHYGRVARRSLAAMLPRRTWQAIRGRARKLKIATLGRSRTVSISRRVYSHNAAFFSVPNITCSYYAGLIAADGCINEKTRSMSLSLCEVDGHLVQSLARAVEYTGPTILRPARGNVKAQRSLNVHNSPGLVADLARNYSIVPRKSLTLQPPAGLDRENAIAFIVGYIDGDGCIGVTTEGYLRLSIRGTKAVLDWVASRLRLFLEDRPCPPRRRARVLTYPSDSTYSYIVTGRDAESMCAGMLGVGAPRLARKWDIAVKKLAQRPHATHPE